MSRDKSKQGFKGQDDSLVVVNVAGDFQTTPGLFHFESPGILENYYSHFIYSLHMNSKACTTTYRDD